MEAELRNRLNDSIRHHKLTAQQDVYKKYCVSHGYKPCAASTLSKFVADAEGMERIVRLMNLRCIEN